VIDPETKRKIIGNEFIKVFEKRRAASKKRKVTSSGWCRARSILTSSNRARCAAVAGYQVASQRRRLPDKMKLKLIEPLKDLFKDEVRRIGRDSACRKTFCSGSLFLVLVWRCAFWAK